MGNHAISMRLLSKVRLMSTDSFSLTSLQSWPWSEWHTIFSVAQGTEGRLCSHICTEASTLEHIRPHRPLLAEWM